LAGTINNMAYKLKILIEEERNWEKSKDELINNVSHDLRTPLTSILGYLDLIANDKYPNEVYLKHYVDIAHEKCLTLKRLIDELFEYSKLNSRELKVNKVSIDLGELLEQVIQGFIPIFKENAMDFKINFDNTKLTIKADPLLIARLFDNLINNAVRYGKKGKCINIELLSEHNEAVVRIVNYGQEIPKEDLAYIFDRFYRVDKSRENKKGGSGLGLAIVKSIIDMHDGSIDVKSDKGITTFEVRLKTNSDIM
jgi:signal transduction histidine kinase